MATQVTESDLGKRVVYEGDPIGRVVAYEDGTAYVEPDAGITDFIMSKIGVADRPDDAFPLQPELVRTVGDDEVVLESEL